MEGLGSLLFFALFFYLMMRFGCGAHMMHGHGGHGHSHSKKKGLQNIDPVCDKAVEVEQGYGKMYQGALYRFCSRTCLDKFDADPEEYINSKEGHKHVM